MSGGSSWSDSDTDGHQWTQYTTEGVEEGNEDQWNSTGGVLDGWPRTVPTQLGPIYAVVEIICAVLSVGGNSVVLYVYIRQQSLHTVKNAYVVSLAVADLLVGLIGIPAALATSVGLPRNFHSCLVMNALLLLLCTASIMSLMAVTVDRLWAIRHPFTYAVTMSFYRGRCVIITCWVVATLVGLLPLFGWNSGVPPVPRCFFAEVIDGRYLVFIFLVFIISPTIFMAVVYALIYHSVIKQGVTMQEFCGDDDLKRRQQQQLTIESRAARSIAVIVIVFVVSWLPLYALNTAAEICPSCHIPRGAFLFTIVLSHYNSVWNPLLYAWGMKDIRKALKQLLVTPSEREQLIDK